MKRAVVWPLAALVLAVVLAVALAVVAVRRAGGTADAHAPSGEAFAFRPALITTAAVAVLEKPTATRALVADAKAEAFRPFLEAFGILCVSNAAAEADARFDIVLAADVPQPGRFGDLLARTGERGVFVLALDVRGMKTSSFRDIVDAFPCPEAHLWMPGAEDWALVGRRTPRALKLDAMLDVFARDSAFGILAEARATALSDVFASYAGDAADIRDAFAAKDLSVPVRPEFFVTREIPATDWIARGDVDDDIYRRTVAEIRSMQVVRRLVLQGDILAAEGKGDDAVDCWSRAMRRNPRDPMLLARYDRLARNADALLRVGNAPAAAKCYETMVLMHPSDAAAVYRYATCLERLGKKEMAREVFARAKELRRGIR